MNICTPVQNGTRLIRAATATSEFPRGLDWQGNGFFSLPFSLVGERYYSSFTANDFIDCSFALIDHIGPLVVVACDTTLPDRLSRFGAPIEVWCSPRASCSQMRRLVGDVMGELAALSSKHGCAIWLCTSHRLDPMGVFTARLLEMDGRGEICTRVWLDLGHSDDCLLSDMRTGHRQQVRWGAANLTAEYVDAANPDYQKFDQFRQLHAHVAGRETRPRRSWEAMYAEIVAGNGDLILTSIGDQLIGGTLILDAEGTAFYASGAYRRDHFDKPLSHYPIFLAAQRARMRGRSRLDVGESYGGTMNVENTKEVQIGKFKGGFAGSVSVSMVWRSKVP